MFDIIDIMFRYQTSDICIQKEETILCESKSNKSSLGGIPLQK